MARLLRWIGSALLALSGLALVPAITSLRGVAEPGRVGVGLEPDALCKSFGVVVSERAVTVPFVLTNRSNRPLKVLGARAVCLRLACLDVAGLPIEVVPGGERSIRVDVRTRGHGDFDDEMTLYTDQVDRPTISLGIKGRVVEDPDAAGVSGETPIP